MEKTDRHSSDGSLADAYREFDRNLRVRQSKVGCFLAILLMPAGASLDYFVYPHMWVRIFEARLLSDLFLVPFFLLLFAPAVQRRIRAVGSFWLASPAWVMCWMIYASEGALSPYYAGLCLVLLAACLLMPYTAREAAALCAVVLVSYTVACLLHHIRPPATAIASAASASGTTGTLFNNLYFLGLTSIVCVTANYHSSRRRFEDFRLRHDLDVNNKELGSTLKKLQDTEVQLVQSEKMNALGKLSAGLLHEVNNPLNFTFMALQMAEQEAEGNAALQDTLKDIEQGMTRIRGVISDLRAFAHPTNGTERERFSLFESLTTARRLCAQELGDIPVVGQAIDAVQAIGSKTQIVHVFMNLLVNAAHATRKKKVVSPQITVSCEEVNGRLKVAVRDNGTGVKKEHLSRVFEPFFTTKDVGQGMGLGLSICHTIVKNHGGNIEIATEEGEWTQISFDLPLEPTKTVSPGDSTPAFSEERLELAGSNA
jgi:two-component system sensor histidine kinase PhcS